MDLPQSINSHSDKGTFNKALFLSDNGFSFSKNQKSEKSQILNFVIKAFASP